MVTVTIEEAKENLSDLLYKALFGEEVFIILANQQSIKLSKVEKLKLERKASCLNA